MFEPALKVGPSGVVSDVHDKGAEVPPESGIAWMGAQKPGLPMKYKHGLDPVS